MRGQTVARLNAARLDTARGDGVACPTRFNAALTTWRVAPFVYRAGPGQGSPVTLTSLISDHYGGAERDTADHVERFYFTRELGGTRWERWQNARGNKQFSAALIAPAGSLVRGDRALRPRRATRRRRADGADRLPRMDPDGSGRRPGRRSSRVLA